MKLSDMYSQVIVNVGNWSEVVEDLDRGDHMPTIDELKAEHQGEWLAILVTARDHSGPTEGVLLHHSKYECEVWSSIKGDSRLTAVTYAGSIVEEGTVVIL